MTVFSLQFLLFTLAAWVAMNIAWRPWIRAAVLLGASGYFLYTFVDDPSLWVWAGAFLASGYGLYLLCAYWPSGRTRDVLFWVWCGVHLALYVVMSKQPFLQAYFPDLPVIGQIATLVGVSYVLLRQLHICFDVRNGVLQRAGALEYFSYMLAFHTLLAGPIMRFGDFSRQLQAGKSTTSMLDIAEALNRIATGLVKKYVLAAVLYAAVHSSKDGWGVISYPRHTYDFWVAFHVFALYEFLEFSGYCDIMIGIGRLIGVVPPENFRRPYVARNIIDFWTRWHITLALWVRDYVFNPLALRITRLTRGRAIVLVSLVCYCAAFFLVGAWHRFSLGFLLWGLSQGVGMGIVKLYDRLLRKVLSRNVFARYQKSRVFRVVATAITVEYFVLTVGFVVLDIWQKL